jgi:CorA-like Mg2+ transporter protein
MARRIDYDWELPPEMQQRLGGTTYGAQRIIHEQGHLMVILHEPPAGTGAERKPTVFLRKPDGAWLHKGNNPGERALAKLLEGYRSAFSTFEIRHQSAETSEDLFQILGPLIPLTRAARNMQDTLQAAREAVKDDQMLVDLRDLAVEISRGFELLLADTRMSLDYRLAHAAEAQARSAMEMNRAQHKLNTIAALTFPLMAIGAAFGMNLHSGAENLPGWVYWVIFAAGIWLGVMLRGWVKAPVAPPVVARPASTLKKK